MPTASLGLDFGTEAVRAILVRITDGAILALASEPYPRGVIDERHPITGDRLPPDYALQHPQDWLVSAALATKRAMADARLSPTDVIGIGVDFTSCTMLPALADGTPLCLTPQFESTPLAWPRLWKHHGAKAEAERMTAIARERNEPWLARYGGTIGLEWFFPKVLETIHHAPAVYQAAEVWLEAGDWFVWQLVSGPFPNCSRDRLSYSSCQAGYKALWNGETGYPSRDYFAAVHPDLANVVQTKMNGPIAAPGSPVGTLAPAMAALLGLAAGTPVSAAIIDAHAGVPGAGVAEPDTLVLVLGTSACHMMNSTVDHAVPGVAGVVDAGILPGFFGYETGQAAVGDALAWLVDQLHVKHADMIAAAKHLPPGSGGVLAIDWLNGCRTPLMDGRLSGGFLGLTLGTKPEQLYRALIEATGFGVRWIVDTLRAGGVPVKRFVASGGMPGKNPLMMQIYADLLGEPISIACCGESVALGAAILGCLAARPEKTGFTTTADAIRAMAGQADAVVYTPDPAATQAYENIYRLYRSACDDRGPIVSLLRQLNAVRHSTH